MENKKILLVSDNKGDIENIQLRLEESIDFPCYIWHCQTLTEALDYLSKRKLRLDIIILDLGLIGTTNPKEIYKKMGEAAINIPIIVLTGGTQEDHDLAAFVMEAGASDHMIRGEFSRIADAIQFALIRYKIMRDVSDKHDRELKDRQNDHDIETTENKRNTDQKNHEKKQYISWVMGGYSVEDNQGQKPDPVN